jgi:hypothetical protein
VALPAVAALLLAGCLDVAPYEMRDGDYVRRVVPQTPERFGSFSTGVIARADFYGNIDGLEPGYGGTATFPLTEGVVMTAAVVVIIAAVAIAMAGGEGGDLGNLGGDWGGGSWDVDDWHSGVGDPSREIISELSFDFTFSGTRHRDRLAGGDLDYFAFLLGMRLGGPRRYVPRYYLSGGWGVYSFNYDNRPYARVTGPYVGAGLEWFAEPNVSAGLDYKVHYYFGDDDSGVPVDGACGQLSAQIAWYW